MPVVGELILGVASTLIVESLKRPIEALGAELRRRDQVSRPLTDRTSIKSARESALLDRVSADLARVIGGKTGRLTEGVNEFLRELRRTTLPETVAFAALSGSSPDPLREPFREFCGRFADLPFSSDQLFGALYEACLARVEDVGDDALLQIVRAQHSDLTFRIEAIAQSLRTGLQESRSYSVAALREARLRVARAIEAESRHVFVETLQGAKKFRLRSLAIPGRLFRLSAQDVSSARITSQTQTISYLAFRRQFDRAVILGDPGGGKSTLTQMVLADQVNLINLESANPGHKQFEHRDLRIPLRIVLRRFESRAIRSPSYSFLDHFRDDIRNALEGDEPLANAYLSAALGSGEAIVIFDGLDEVLDVGARRRMVEQIEQFSQIYAACPVLVTSRLVGYRDAPLSDEFTNFGLARFNDEEIGKYSQKAIAAVGQMRVAEAKIKSAEFVTQSARVAADLRENPLMLGLMVQIFVYRGDVPNNRPEVYRECATLMFEKWDGRRDIIADVPRHDVELLDVFGYVASRTFGDASIEEGVSRDWLVRELRDHFEDWYVDRASANRAANSLVDFLTGRAWVMSEVGPGIFKFTHRTFLEYFFARNLISESISIEDLISIDLIPRVISNQWSVIAHLALHMAVFRDGGKSRQAANTLNRLMRELTLPANEELSFLRFVSSAISYLIIPEATYLSIVEQCVTRSIALGALEDVSALGVIETLSSSAGSREVLVHDEIIRQLTAHLSGPERPHLLFAMYAIGMGRGDLFGYGLFLDEAVELWVKLKELRESARPHLRDLATKHVNVAKAFIYVYADSRDELFAIHERDLLLSSSSNLVPMSVDDWVLQAIRAIILAPTRTKDYSVADCKAVIRRVASAIIAGDVNLSRLMQPRRMRGAGVNIDGEISMLWRRAYVRKAQSIDASVAECLVCMLSMIDIDETSRHETQKKRRERLPVPERIILQLVDRIEHAATSRWLDSWCKSHLGAQMGDSPELL